MTNTLDLAAALSTALDAQTSNLARLDAYYEGRQPAAFLAPEAREALGDRLSTVAVNFPRLVVNSISERLTVEGFKTDDPAVARDLARVWRRNRLVDGSAQAHTEALALGRAFAIVWAGASPTTPRVTIESARQVTVVRDPATGDITAAAKRWSDGGYVYLTVFEPDQITRYVSASAVPEGGTISPTGWKLRADGVVANPLGVVPVVAFVNRGRLMDANGVSEMADVLALSDAVTKLNGDMLVTSEFYARPRRWATGLEVVEDEDGKPVNPFTTGPERVWQSESPETKFGQFDAARLDGYGDAVASLTQQIGALSGLPPHYLGLHGDQPASADAIRSAEASLVSTAKNRQRAFGESWADVARLVYAIQHGVDVETLDVETVWADAETRTPAQAADAAAKQRGIGVALETVQDITLGWTPGQIEADREARRRERGEGLAA